jgi:peptidoglycan/LPS O-acetylase OafA/YrhL
MRARLPALDGLRAVAALLVVATHAAYLTGFTSNGDLLGRLAGRGDFGVAIFFALSGFLLHHGLASDARDGRTDVRAYAVRRAARVLPAYWVTLVVVVVAVQPPVRTTVAQALAIQTYVPGTDLDAFSQSWSIPTELSFYVVLPLVVLLLERARRRNPALPVAILVGTAVASVVALAVVPVGVVGEDALIERWLPARWPNFAVGMLLAEVALRPAGRLGTQLVSWSRDTGGCLLVAGAAFVLATTPIAGPLTLGPVSGVQLSARLALSTIVAGFLLAPLVLGRDDAYSSALGSGPARAVGRVSYGLFLWHLPVFAAIYAVTAASVFKGGILPLLAVGLPISLGLAWLSHVAVELPAMRWAARLAPHPRAPLQR